MALSQFVASELLEAVRASPLAPAVATVLIQPLPKPPTTMHSATGLANVENRGSIDPRTFELIGRLRWIPAPEVPGDAMRQELRLTTGRSEDAPLVFKHARTGTPCSRQPRARGPARDYISVRCGQGAP